MFIQVLIVFWINFRMQNANVHTKKVGFISFEHFAMNTKSGHT